MEPESSLPHSHVPATCPYPEPAWYSPYPHSTSSRSILIFSLHLHLGLPSGLFSSDSPTKTPSLLAHKTALEQDQDVPFWPCSKAVFKPVWHKTEQSVQWINSWWWAEEMPETRRVSCRNKFGKLLHLLDFMIKKFVTMHGHMNVKLQYIFITSSPGVFVFCI